MEQAFDLVMKVHSDTPLRLEGQGWTSGSTSNLASYQCPGKQQVVAQAV